jgi:hypothetical protein
MQLRFKLTAEDIELNPWLEADGYVEGDIFEIDVRNTAEGRVGPRPGDKNPKDGGRSKAKGE